MIAEPSVMQSMNTQLYADVVMHQLSTQISYLYHSYYVSQLLNGSFQTYDSLHTHPC